MVFSQILGSVMCSYGSLYLFLSHYHVFVCLFIYYFVLSVSCVFRSLDFPPLYFWIFFSPAVVITDPNSDCETLILKLGSGGLPPALPPCVYFAASPPRSLSMTPGDDGFHPWCRSDVTHSSTSVSPSHPVTLSPPLSLPLLLQSVLTSSVWSGVSFALPRY